MRAVGSAGGCWCLALLQQHLPGNRQGVKVEGGLHLADGMQQGTQASSQLGGCRRSLCREQAAMLSELCTTKAANRLSAACSILIHDVAVQQVRQQPKLVEECHALTFGMYKTRQSFCDDSPEYVIHTCTHAANHPAAAHLCPMVNYCIHLCLHALPYG